jgi:CubicO group peptidase (beta-lactamase class C family)
MTLRCVVHDPKGYVFSGVSGSAGLFSTSRDIKNFMQMMLNKGIYVTKEGK